MYCKKCGAQIDDDSVFCEKCGCQIHHKLDSETYAEESKFVQMKCSDCGAIMDLSKDATILFCPYCKSQKLMLMSDNVQIEKIRSNDNKEVNVEKIHSEERLKMKEQKHDNFMMTAILIVAIVMMVAGCLGEIFGL